MSEDKDLQEKEMQGREASDGNTKEDEYEKVCFLCRRPESKTGPMITLPQNIHICTECSSTVTTLPHSFAAATTSSSSSGLMV